jgi:acetoin utilization deacetylase AcuC-like enzyme
MPTGIVLPPSAALLVSDTRFQGHRPLGYHPERPERLIAATAAMLAQGPSVLWKAVPARALSQDELVQAHSPQMIETLFAWRGRQGFIDNDTFVSPESVNIALEASGAIADMVHAIMKTDVHKGMAIVRPPGHHATRNQSMGFCLVNNVAIAAYAALASGAARVAIIDFDVHHGNGTEDIFRDDPRVLYISTHQSPLYPGSGNLFETGSGEGKGFTVNIPLSEGGDDGVYRAAFERIVLPVLDEFAPSMLLVSAGFDAATADPLAQMDLSSAAFGWMSNALAHVSGRHAGGKMALVLEGGYDLPSLEHGLNAAIRGMLGEAFEIALASGSGDVNHAVQVHKQRWKLA